MGAAAEADLDVAGGEAQLADAVDQVSADRVGRLVVVGRARSGGRRCRRGRERDVEVDRERDLGAERVEVEGADLFCELFLDSPALSVAFDQLFDGWLLLVGEDQGGLVAAEAVDGDLPEGSAFDRGWVFVVGGGLVFAEAVKPGFGPRAGGEALRARRSASGSAA